MNDRHAEIFYKEILKIQNREKCSWQEKSDELWRLLVRICLVATEEEKIQFSNFFARSSYVFQKFEIEKKTQFYLHAFRRTLRDQKKNENYADWEALYELGLKFIIKLVTQIWKIQPDKSVKSIEPPIVHLQFKPTEIVDFQSKSRVVAMADLPQLAQLVCLEESTGAEIKVQYNIADRNENFNPTIRAIREIFGFPVTMNLLDVEVDAEGIYHPRAFVLEPDFLVDVTSVAECFQPEGTEPVLYLLKKFMPFESSGALIIGNIANFFLDELIADPEKEFMALFAEVFKLFPLQFALMDDGQVRQIMEAAKGHFSVLKKMVKGEFQNNSIQLENCYLEPSFYSETYGLQGRLDVFHEDGKKSAIIELKSGKAFMPNQYGLSNNHFTQTLLYDLLIKSTYQNAVEPLNYILYSSSYERPLRFAPAVKSQQMEAIQIRNQLVTIEKKLSKFGLETGQTSALENLQVRLFPNIKGYQRVDLEIFEKTYQGMTPLMKSYFNHFAGFVAREHRLAKTGIEGVESANGLASLWLDSFEDKQQNFDLISFLKIAENKSEAADPVIIFEKTEKTNPLANFRIGDIACMYPYRETGDSVLQSQVFKVTIVELNKSGVTVRLRSRQSNQAVFQSSEFWNLEHDLLDSSFVGMYRGLFEFAKSPSEKTDLLLTLRPPAEPEPVKVDLPAEMTAEQRRIFRKLLASKDYFLLWGPPGTGKTSMMLKHIVDYFLNRTEENLLLLAYTNRAVDEICEAIESIGDDMRDVYLRIGSRFGADSRFHGQLLDQKIDVAKNRSELKKILNKHRIFVATVASFQGKSELLKLKHFNRVIIDEASQILEPMLAGLLPMFEHFTLIGDHKQLPAVVVQDARFSAVDDAKLHEIGLENMRNSFFERLFLRCEKENWTWAFDRLSHQGRMHHEIMQFSNEHFYGGFLQILPPEFDTSQIQSGILEYTWPERPTDLETKILKNRVVFLPTEPDLENGFQKTNLHEARMVVETIKAFQKILKINGQNASIGVITPYRAQIALITDQLTAEGIDPDLFTVDTVERYQGGARDIVIISFCTNTDAQIANMTSLMADGTDRKLNVALTRARRHLVLIGSPELMKSNAVFEKLLSWAAG